MEGDIPSNQISKLMIRLCSSSFSSPSLSTNLSTYCENNNLEDYIQVCRYRVSVQNPSCKMAACSCPVSALVTYPMAAVRRSSDLR